MKEIAVIGAGQLGSRHIQGLAKFSKPFELHIVDPFESSVRTAQERLHEVGDNPNIRGVFTHSSPATLPKSIDLTIIATTSDVRFTALQALCSSTSVKNLILEKVLFQRFSEYEDAATLLRQHCINCWVNCPRRIYPIYTQVKDFFADDPIKYMDVYGGDWGLGCNGIHFLDLLAFLSGRNDFSFNTGLLDTERRVSKRAGFIEFTGTLQGKLDDATFNLSSIYNSSAKHLITLRGEEKSVIIDETAGCLWQIDKQGSELVKFSLPYQSQLTGQVAESILFDGGCGLTSYEESAKIHLPFLKALATFGLVGDPPTLCPLT